MKHVVMPALGMAMTECLLLRWLKDPGDLVVAGEPVAEIETDKATTEIESPGDGAMGRHLVAPGSVVAVGSTISWILEHGEPDPEGDEAPEATADRPVPEPVRNDTAQVPPDSGVDAARGAREPHGMSPRARREARQAAQRAAAAPASATTEQARSEGSRTPEVVARGASAYSADSVGDDVLAPIEVAGVAPAILLGWLRRMVLIRTFERESVRLSIAGHIPGGIHSSEGQEAVAVGVISSLGPDDAVAGTHRSHHHALARGMTPRSIMAELWGKADGCARGRGGSMHIVDPALHFLGSNGIVGAGVGLATGAGLAFHLRGIGAVGVGFFGDGGANTGRVWESVNLAAAWKLPVVVVCENNLYAVETRITATFAGASIADRASGFGLPAFAVDGQDVVAVHRVASAARRRALDGGGPTFIEARTYRYEGHNVGDIQNYRGKDEVAEWRARRDPIERLRLALVGLEALDERAFAAIAAEAEQTVADAVQYARDGAWPSPDDRGASLP
jgi:TPP-dependent pyruvate/acetoin dehydrogenase alpha subunit